MSDSNNRDVRIVVSYWYDVDFCIYKAFILNVDTGDHIIYPMETETIPKKVLDYYVNKLTKKED